MKIKENDENCWTKENIRQPPLELSVTFGEGHFQKYWGILEPW